MTRKKRKGYTLLEVAISFACIGIMMAGVFSATNLMSKTKAQADSSIVMNAFVVSAVETINADLEDGVDILSLDYNNDARIYTGSLNTNITISFQQDVFNHTLYLLKIDMADKVVDYRQVVRILLRGDPR